jgi:hypothetical protein
MGIRRAITPEARPLFDATAAWLARELERIPVEGVVLGTGGVSGAAGLAADAHTAPDGGLSPSMAPLEVGPGSIRSVNEAPEQEGDDPLDESEEPQ